MYLTHLILPNALSNFNSNSLADFEYYVFILVPTKSDFELALRKFGPILAASDACCFLTDQDEFEKLTESKILESLFLTARATAPLEAVSFIAAISRSELLKSESPQGAWFELFLAGESQENKEKRLRQGIQKALAAQPRDFSTYGPIVASILGTIARLATRGHG